MARAGRSTYSSVAITLHWLIGLLIIANIALVLSGGPMPWHKSIGMTVLVLSLLRWAWRLGHRPPPLPATVRPWEKGLAHALHWTFYLLIVLIPLSGWAMSSGSLKPRPLNWFGLFDIPYLPITRGGALYETSHEFHEIMGLAMIGLIALHILGALKHQFFDGDATLHRILPVVSPRKR